MTMVAHMLESAALKSKGVNASPVSLKYKLSGVVWRVDTEIGLVDLALNAGDEHFDRSEHLAYIVMVAAELVRIHLLSLSQSV